MEMEWNEMKGRGNTDRLPQSTVRKEGCSGQV